MLLLILVEAAPPTTATVPLLGKNVYFLCVVNHNRQTRDCSNKDKNKQILYSLL